MEQKDKLKFILTKPIIFLQSLCKIVDKKGKLIEFKLNPQQRELIKSLEKYSIVLKSRQLGITTVSCGLSLFHAITEPNSHCMMISYSLDSANAIFDKLKSIYDNLPKFIKLKDIANNRKELKFSNGSKITVTTMGSKEIARGSSLKFVHISELAFCKQDLVTKQLLAIEQALLPNGKVIIESTANGMNEFSELWAKAENGESLYKPFFFSWIDDKIMFKAEYIDFAKRYKNLKGSSLTEIELEPIEKDYFNMGANLEQLMWRRLKISNSSEDKFKQEYPATPIEAFITSGNNIFDSGLVQVKYNASKNFKKLNNIQVSQILKPYINSYIKFYDEVKFGVKYWIGVDASEGIGQDFSVISVYNNDLVEVCQFRSNKVAPYDVANICYELAKYYNNAVLVVEKASGGHIILDRLVHTHKYKNLYKHKDYDVRGKIVKKVGYNTTTKTKPILINDFVEMFENNDILIKSSDTLKEMKTYVFNGVSMNAERGRHDDCIIATALAIQGYKSNVRYM
ncbi:MAG: hypothetical protein R3Y35_07210 [Clostridia bacterium]